MPSPTGAVPVPAPPERARRPRRGEQLELGSKGSRTEGPEWRAWSATSCSSRARSPASGCGPRSPARSATTRTHAPSRCWTRARTGCPCAAITRAENARARPGRPCATSASSSTRSSWSATRCAGSAASRASCSSRSWRPRTSGATATRSEYSFGPSEETPPQLRLGFHARGRWDRVNDARDCLLASERNNAVRNFVRDWCTAQGLGPLDRRTADRLSCATSSCARAGAPGTCRCASLRLPGSSTWTRSADALGERFPDASFLWTRTSATAEVTDDGTTEVVSGNETPHGALGDLEFSISPDAFFQTNTEMAESLYALACDYADLRGTRARVRPVLRHRHAQPDARVASRRGVGRRRSWRRRSATRSATRS